MASVSPALLLGLALLLVAADAMAPRRRLRRDDEDYEDEKYTSRYDNVDLDEVLHSDRLLTNYFRCLMDRGPCTPDARELRKVLPEALKEDCSKCSERHRNGAEKVLTFLIKNRKKEWTELEKKFDPTGLYRKRYEAEATKRGIKLDA